MSDPNMFYRPTDLNFNAPSVDIKPLMQLAQADQKPATKQKASTNSQGGVDPTVVQNIGKNLGVPIRQWIDAYRQQMQRYGVGQPQQGVAGQPGPIATPPRPAPMVPQQLRPQQSTTPDAYFPNVTGSLY